MTADSASKEEFWALKDVSFDIEQGDRVGIIGRNGAGKSTLLKILSRITEPTTGQIKIKGRVASLLEVGTGFHPELTGRENVYLNGAILGMSRAEIKKHFNAIVDFSGVEKFIDTPVKRYSSGMYVRLAFAVAAHLEPEILIVDEVLAVGDAEFQKKCLGKMEDISKNEGRTILFVSHNMQAIKAICQKGIYLKNGLIEYINTSNNVIDFYLGDNRINKETGGYSNLKGNEAVYVKYAICENINGEEKYMFSADEDILIKFAIVKKSSVRGVYGHVMIKSMDETIILETDTIEQNENTLDNDKIGKFATLLKIPKRILKTGSYYISLGLASHQSNPFQIEFLDSFLKFDVIADRTQRDFSRIAINSIILEWGTYNK